MDKKNYVEGKSIIVTGAAGGFGKLVSAKAAALGAKVTCADIDQAILGRDDDKDVLQFSIDLVISQQIQF